MPVFLLRFGVLLGVFMMANPALAMPSFLPSSSVAVSLPESAGQAKVFLGNATDPQSGKKVEGYALIRYKEGHQKRGAAAVTESPASMCYGFLSQGAKWRSVEPWLINPANKHNLSSSGLLTHMTSGVGVWEDAANGVMNDNVSSDVLGNGRLTSNRLKADTGRPDGKNEVYFGSVSSSGAIAVTIVWGTFNAPVEQRELIEWDQVYDEADYKWSMDAASDTSKMDFGNIATHELGHSVGMDDLYDSVCAGETMYGYATQGETSKRDLFTGDIAGMDILY